MNDQSNAPMMPSEGSQTIFRAWMNALTKPNEKTYAEIASLPYAKASQAFFWVFVGFLINYLFASLVQGALMRQYLQQLGLGDQLGGSVGSRLITIICGAPIGGAIGVLFFAIFIGVIQLLARAFGGHGTYNQLAYAIAAITVPFSFISAVLTLLSAIPYVGFCFSILSLLGLIYVIVLEVMAVKGVNQFGWGQAAGSLLLPFVLLCCCLSVGVIGIMRVLGPRINDIFNQINQSVAP